MKIKVAVLYGGRSGEHEISLRSAESIMNALDPERYDVVAGSSSTRKDAGSPRPILPEPGGNPGIDVVFPVLHGTFGEDGTVQGLLELADLPYVGPGVLASSAAMDKEVTKRLLLQAGLPVVEYITVAAAPEERGHRNPLRIPGVREAREPGLVGWDLEGEESRGTSEAIALAAPVRHEDHRRARDRRAWRLECAVLGNREHAKLRFRARFCRRVSSTITKTSIC